MAFYQPLHSTLQWPNSTVLQISDWQLMEQDNCHLYTTNQKLKLATTLGPWMMQYSQYFQWTWQLCAETLKLYQFISPDWYAYKPQTTKQKYVHYSHFPIFKPTTLVILMPATPAIHHSPITITLPLFPVPQPASPDQHDNDIINVKTNNLPTSWEKPLDMHNDCANWHIH